MQKQLRYFFFSVLSFLLSYLLYILYSQSLELNSLSPVISSRIDSNERIDLKSLTVGQRYVAVFRSYISSDNLHILKLPGLRDPQPQYAGEVLLKTKIGATENSFSFKFYSGLFSRLAKAVKRKSNGSYELIRTLVNLKPISSEDYLEVSLSTQKAAFAEARIDIYKIETLLELVLFYPLAICILCLLFLGSGIGLAIVGIVRLIIAVACKPF